MDRGRNFFMAYNHFASVKELNELKISSINGLELPPLSIAIDPMSCRLAHSPDGSWDIRVDHGIPDVFCAHQYIW